jgi:hypothetical protein
LIQTGFGPQGWMDSSLNDALMLAALALVALQLLREEEGLRCAEKSRGILSSHIHAQI